MAGHRIASLLKASPEGEGIHPSQIGTLSSPPRRTQRTRRKNPVLNRFKPPILRVPRGGEAIFKRSLRTRPECLGGSARGEGDLAIGGATRDAIRASELEEIHGRRAPRALPQR